MREMGNAPRGLDGEFEAGGGGLRPLLQHLAARHAIERVIDFYRRQPRTVEGEHALGLHVRRIERTFPLLERVATGAGKQPHCLAPRISAWRKRSLPTTRRNASSAPRPSR